jgi:hypothetical protein
MTALGRRLLGIAINSGFVPEIGSKALTFGKLQVRQLD